MEDKLVAAARDAADDTGDSEVNIVTERTEHGGVKYVDPVLAKLGRQLVDARVFQQQINRVIRELEKRQNARLQLLHGLGSLALYPTEMQRRFVQTFEVAAQFGNVVMLKMAYDNCIQADVHKTNYKYLGEEPIMVAFARLAAELAAKDE